MLQIPIRAFGLAVLLATTGCISGRPSSFVSPTMPSDPKPTAADLQKVDALVALDLAFTTNGTPNAYGTKKLRKMVVERLAALGVARVATDPAEPVECKLRIAMENLGNLGEALLKGFGSGLTFGLVGANVADRYVLDATVECAGKEPVQKTYRHLIITRVGAGKGPAGQTAVSPEEAFRTVLDDLLIALVRDLQAEGLLVPATTS